MFDIDSIIRHQQLQPFDLLYGSQQVAFNPDSTEVWVTLLNGTGFQVFDPLDGELIASLELPEAGSVEVMFNKAGTKGYISQMETASVYEIDAGSKTVLQYLLKPLYKSREAFREP